MRVKWPEPYPGGYWLDEREERAVLDVLRRGALFRYYGLKKPRYVETLERTACRFYGVQHALAVNSGTGALSTAMTALGIGPGCEVIVPAFFWVATAGAVVGANAIPVLCEVDDSLSLDPRDLARKITPRTRLIVPVHMAGAPCDMQAVMAVADQHGIPVLADEARAMRTVERMQAAGLRSAVRLTDYGLHIYYNVPQLVQKIPLSPAGNPWSLPQNKRSVCDYQKGVCPRSDRLFARSILLPVPSRLTAAQEKAAAEIIRAALRTPAPRASH